MHDNSDTGDEVVDLINQTLDLQHTPKLKFAEDIARIIDSR